MEKCFIFKFGGSCLKDKEALEKSLEIIKKYKTLGKIIVVTSAFFGITNRLLNWIDGVASNNEISTSIEELNEINNFHKKIIEEMILHPEIKNESIEFLDQKIQELSKVIPKIKEGLNSEIIDFVVSYGERISTFIYSRYLNDKGYDADYFSADDKLLITNDIFGNSLPLLGKIDHTIPERLNPTLRRNGIAVFTGYYGCTEHGRVTTLGRGGTDFTSTIIAYAFARDYRVKVIFWKDVYGLMSANPKFEPHAKILKHISFSEAKELAFFGSKVLHPLCLITAEKRGVEVELRNFEDPFDEKSTIISKKWMEEESVIKAITSISEIAMVTVQGEAMVSLPGAAAKLFSTIGNNNININFISQSSSEHNITFGVSTTDGIKTSEILTNSRYFGKRWFRVRVEDDVSLLAVVGAGMIHTPGIAGKVFKVLGDNGINIRAIAQGSSEMNISFVIERVNLQKAITLLYHTFIEIPKNTMSFW